MILETVVTTVSAAGEVHVAPMGIREEDGRVLLAPFKPSRTLDNVLATRRAVVNLTDDVRIFAGCVTGRREWPTVPAGSDGARRLRDTLAHREVEIDTVEDDDLRPRIWCREKDHGVHAPFRGFNRAQAAVLEAAVLVSRLHMLPAEKIEREVDYLTIAIEKTAGSREREAWSWLMAAVERWRAEQPA